MTNLFKAFLYKLTKDWTFRITLIIGLGIAVLLTIIYGLIDVLLSDDLGFRFLTGPEMYVNSMSPMQNFGIAIPINLITFTCLEFSQGTIRNKIIAGHSKAKIYTSLFLSGLVFTFVVLFAYIGICTALGTIFGGFDLNTPIFSFLGTLKYTGEYLLRISIICVVTYISIVSFTVFASTLTRSIGPSIPLVIMVLMVASFTTTILGLFSSIPELDTLMKVLTIVNPLHAITTTESDYENGVIILSDFTFYAGIINNLAYAALFFIAGVFIFKKSDVK